MQIKTSIQAVKLLHHEQLERYIYTKNVFCKIDMLSVIKQNL